MVVSHDDVALFLLNLLLVIFLFFMYYKYFEEKYTRYSTPVMITIVSGISIFLTMFFSITPIEGFFFDARHVPFIIGALYGGRKIGFILLVILLSFRFYLGGTGFWIATFEFTLIYCLLWFYIPRFKNVTKLRKKVNIAIIISTVSPINFVFFVAVLKLDFSVSQYILLFILHTIPILGVVIFVNLIENTRKENLLIKEVKELEKIKIVSEIAASISHEVRNPLTVTSGFLQLLRSKDISHDQRVEYIELSLSELKRAENVISDYLTFAKPSLENVEVLNVKDEIEYVINVVAPFALMNNAEIHFERFANVVVAGEKQKLHQSLVNLIKNGIESMPMGGEITISLEESKEHALISILDRGVGMTQKQIDRLGTPYYTTKGVKGTGLGTMVVYSIIKAMRGKITVRSEVDKGTCFTITLPKVSPMTK